MIPVLAAAILGARVAAAAPAAEPLISTTVWSDGCADPEMDWFFRRFGRATWNDDSPLKTAEQAGLKAFSPSQIANWIAAARRVIDPCHNNYHFGGTGTAVIMLRNLVYPEVKAQPDGPLARRFVQDLYAPAFVARMMGQINLEGALPDAWWTREKVLEMLQSYDGWDGAPGAQLFASLPSALSSDRTVLTTLLERAPSVFEKYPEEIRSDPIMSRRAVELAGYNYEALPPALKRNRKLALLAVKSLDAFLSCSSDGDCRTSILDRMPKALRHDRDILRTALMTHAHHYHWVPESRAVDRDILEALLSSDGFMYAVQDELPPSWLRPDVAKRILKIDRGPWFFERYPAALRADRSLALLAVSRPGWGRNLAYVSEALRDDPVVVDAAYRSDRCAIVHASDRLRNLYAGKGTFDPATCAEQPDGRDWRYKAARIE